jgi:hypothetical protein
MGRKDKKSIDSKQKKSYDGGRLMLELEQRILLSADQPGAGIAQDIFDHPLITDSHTAQLDTTQEDDNSASVTQEQEQRELVIIDSRTPDAQTLFLDLLTKTDDGRVVEMVVLDADRDGIQARSDQFGQTAIAFGW